MLGYWLSQKSENNVILPTSLIKQPHNFVRKTKNYLKKPQMTLTSGLYPDFSEGKEERQLGRCFLPNSRHHSICFRKLFQF